MSLAEPSFMRTRRLLTCAMAMLLLGILLLGLRAYSQYSVAQQFRAEMERLGARVQVVGYRGVPTGVGRVPIIGELLTTQRHIELTVEKVETLETVLNAAAQFPALSRININTSVFGLRESEGIANRIRARQPDVDIVYYMPRPQLKTSTRPM